MWTVAETATRLVLTVTPETPVGDCELVMLQHGLRHLPIVDENKHPVAVVTDQRVLGLTRRDLGHIPAQSASEPIQVLVPETAEMKPVVEQLLGSSQRAAILVDGAGRLTGIFTEHDAMRLAEVALKPWLKVGDLTQSTLELVSVPVGTEAYVARQMMLENGVRHLLVTTQKGRLAGVIAMRDIAGLEASTVDARMNAVVHQVSPEDDLHQAVSVMVRHSVGSLAVVAADHTPVGVITRTDIMRAVLKQLEAE